MTGVTELCLGGTHGPHEVAADGSVSAPDDGIVRVVRLLALCGGLERTTG